MPAVGHRHLAADLSEFRIYAPGKSSLAVVLQADHSRHPLTASADGWWTGRLPRLAAGTLYRIAVDGRALPDPASRCQPEGVHGPSMVVDVKPAHSPGWTGVAMADAIIYELHLGTFTAEGTLAAARARLPYLRDLGINVVELLPIAAFPGERNWGYDGTYLFALHADYGSFADLKAFIEAAHQQGIAAVMASPFVPMLFMGEEYGETAPFLFFEDFSDPAIIEGCREGRKADVGGGKEPPDPHARSSFVASKLNWALTESAGGAAVLGYYRQLIALKRSGSLGPRDMAAVNVRGDAASGLITLEAPRTLTLLNFSGQALDCPPIAGWVPQLSSASGPAVFGRLPPYTALICCRV